MHPKMKMLRRNLSLIILALACVFFLYNASSGFTLKKKSKKTSFCETKQEVTTYRPFVVIIASYNNVKYYEKNLRSVFEQNYPNYRVIYIDDASTDGMGEKVDQFLLKESPSVKMEVIHNAVNKKPLENFYWAIHSCRDEEILVFLDGDDWLAHDKVLRWLNQCYEDPSIWMTYGSYLEYPSYRRWGKKIPEEVHKKRSYRELAKKKFLITHLKTGYAGLFKKVKLQDLLEEGKFYPMAQDQALCLPAQEMAHRHSHFIRDILYIYNRDNVLNDDKVDRKMQIANSQSIQSRPSYSPIDSWQGKQTQVDLVIICKEGPIPLLATLESIKEFVSGYEKIWIVGEKNEPLEKLFPRLHFIKKREDLQASSADYFLVCDDEHLFEKKLDVGDCALHCQAAGVERCILEEVVLEKTLAYTPSFAAGYFSPGQNLSVDLVEKEAFFADSKDFSLCLYAPKVCPSPCTKHLPTIKIDDENTLLSSY